MPLLHFQCVFISFTHSVLATAAAAATHSKLKMYSNTNTHFNVQHLHLHLYGMISSHIACFSYEFDTKPNMCVALYVFIIL